MSRRAISFLSLLILFYLSPAISLANDNLRGYFAILQVQISDLQKDATLIGIKKEKILEAAKEQIRDYNLTVSEDKKKPGLVIRITTTDVGPHIVSYISLSLKEVARIQRLPHPTFVTSWTAGTMVSSQPMKHEAFVLKALHDLIERFATESLK